MQTLQFLERYGYLVLFAWVLVDQVGIPIPALPLLIGMGALAGAGEVSLAMAVGVAMLASILADVVWFSIARRRGHPVLARLCRITLEPDSCVRRTQTIFVARGLKTLLIAKFLPGLNTLAAALAGIVGVSRRRFVAYDVAGAALWAGTWTGLGYLFSDAIDQLVATIARLGGSVAALLAAALGAYVLIKYIQRRLFFRSLRIARIAPEELKGRLDAGEQVGIVDLRAALDVEAMPWAVPGAFRIAAEDLERRHAELPHHHEIVLYCT